MNVNLAWRDAMQEVSQNFTREEGNAGWQPAFESAQLAALQRFDGTHADRVNLWRQLVDECERQTLNHEPNGHKEVIDNPGRWVTQTKGGCFYWDGTPVTERVVVGRTTKTVNLYRIAAADFAAWLTANEIEPSRFVAAWFKAVGVDTETRTIERPPLPDEPVATKKSKEERQGERLQMCIDAGLPMNERALRRMPDGIGKVAEKAGVSRQTFTADVRAALARKIERERPKPRLVPKKR